MELAKLLLKVLYLVLLYAVIFAVLKPRVQMEGANMSVIALALAVLIMYFTFESLYKFMMTNEIVIQSEDKDKKDKTVKKQVKKELVDKVHESSSNNYMFDHTHKYIEDKVFE